MRAMRRRAGVDERAALEMLCTQLGYRRFESSRLRQKGFCKCELSTSLRSAANLYGIFGEKEMNLSIRAKEIFHTDFFVVIF